jgi:dephospho-CoA kinase
LDRAKFGALIFSDSQARAKLSTVQDEIIRTELFKRCASSQSDLVFMDIPLLFEKAYTGFDEIWLVYAPKMSNLNASWNGMICLNQRFVTHQSTNAY